MAERKPLTGESPATTGRRDFLRRSLGLGVTLGLGGFPGLELLAEAASEAPDAELWRGGVRLADLAFQGERDDPLGSKISSGLDARLYTDLSRLAHERLITPASEFFVRTEAPDGLRARDRTKPWTITLGGRVAEPRTLTPADLEPRTADRGVHLIECAGNTRFTRFGLMSAARWDGVQLEEVLAQVDALPGDTFVRVAGFDEHSQPSVNSTAGCSWIFSREQLQASGAFLATRMNGQPLSLDHGFPVRLVVPGWYGCCCVKWVTRIDLVDGNEPATSQMREFALRTHQQGEPELAADYQPATVDRAALAIRIERWRVGDTVGHRVVGITWGGDPARGKLRIRFRPDRPFEPVRYPPHPDPAGTSWALWYHPWSPSPGRYLLELELDDPTSPSRRLRGGFYVRAVAVEP